MINGAQRIERGVCDRAARHTHGSLQAAKALGNSTAPHAPWPRCVSAWLEPSTFWSLQVGKGQWSRVLEMVKKIRGLDMEVCTTLGMVTPEQAADLREAGLTAYNHNLDTSPEYYAKVTSTRKYSDRLETIGNVRSAGISVCAGGIIGLGEGAKDRVGLLLQLATLPAHPESVPINRLVAIPGTPFEGNEVPTGLDLVRCIATARMLMPRTVVRLSAGRTDLSAADQVRRMAASQMIEPASMILVQALCIASFAENTADNSRFAAFIAGNGLSSRGQ
jgi:biotin synthase-like enzyme